MTSMNVNIMCHNIKLTISARMKIEKGELKEEGGRWRKGERDSKGKRSCSRYLYLLSKTVNCMYYKHILIKFFENEKKSL